MASKSPTKRTITSVIIGDAACWYCAIVLVALIMLSCSFELEELYPLMAMDEAEVSVGGNQLFGQRACDEIYVVGEGETLHTIGDKCGDPFIVEKNPHIHDPDDVFPGLVIKITPSKL